MARNALGALEVTVYPGLVPFSDAWREQQARGRALENLTERRAQLMLLEHASVYTLGRMTQPAHVSTEATASGDPAALLRARTKAEVLPIERGGSVTYHGPGQQMAYLQLNLKSWALEIHRHLWNLEEAAIRTLAAFGLRGERIEGQTGVWCEHAGAPAKVCAIGVTARRWVTYHGLCLNVDLDFAPFALIDPCGLGRKPVTSLAALLGRRVTLNEVHVPLQGAFRGVLGV